MKKSLLLLFILCLTLLTISSCKKNIYGCTNPSAYNYNPNANINNGSCVQVILGCTDPTATNYNSNANTDNGSCTYSGNVMFWFSYSHGTGTVTINGQTQPINGYVTGGTPTCGNAVSANFTLPVGSYSYAASATNGNTWNGTATVVANGCQLYQLN